jgi:chorismate mutase-like protein
MEIKTLRKKIDALDTQLLKLLNDRTRLATQVGRLKVALGQRVFAPDREEHLLRQLESKNRGPMPNASLRAIYREIMSSSRASQGDLAIAYLGGEGSATWAAARHRFGTSSTYRPCASFAAVVRVLQHHQAESAVVSRSDLVRYLASSGLVTPRKFAVCGDLDAPVTSNGRRESYFLLCREPALMAAHTKTVVILVCNWTPKSVEKLKCSVEIHDVRFLRAERLSAKGRKGEPCHVQLELGGYVAEIRFGAMVERCAGMVRQWFILGTYPEVPDYA